MDEPMEGVQEMNAEHFAAEAMAADMAEWIVFDARRFNPEEGLENLEQWLSENLPSHTNRDDGIGWIAVQSKHKSSNDSARDVIGLQESWEQLKDSARPVCLQTITELAQMHHVLSGKWLFHVSTGLKVNHMWSVVARATVMGNLGRSAKVSSYEGDSHTHVVCIYNDDFTNTEQVLDLENRIRAAGIKCQLLYKPDVFTNLGIYRHNSWNLRPSIHESVFDLATNCSKVTSIQ